MNNPGRPECGAYHEAGHIAVAAAQGMPLSIYGVHVDRDGKGISYYDCRKPEPVRRQLDRKGEHTVISLFAGLIAQQKFCTNCPATAASSDNDWVERLLPQMYLEGASVEEMKTSETRLNEARKRLREEASRLVEKHWNAIDTLAKALWAKPFTPRLPDEPEKCWSPHSEERTINGAGIVAILKEFGICTSLSEQ